VQRRGSAASRTLASSDGHVHVAEAADDAGRLSVNCDDDKDGEVCRQISSQPTDEQMSSSPASLAATSPPHAHRKFGCTIRYVLGPIIPWHDHATITVVLQ